MAQIEFVYNGNNIIIPCNINEKMKDIFNRFIIKEQINEKSIYYLYNGELINEELTYDQVIKLNNNKIIVYSNDNKNNNNSIIKSKYIICPKCGENCRIKIENYKIKLYDCKNGHILNNISLNEYENLLNIDISKIKCDKCKDKNKGNCHNNEFYRCITCKNNLCPLCKLNHEQNHEIINYDQIIYVKKIMKYL